jgi:hypothetical protein
MPILKFKQAGSISNIVKFLLAENIHVKIDASNDSSLFRVFVAAGT